MYISYGAWGLGFRVQGPLNAINISVSTIITNTTTGITTTIENHHHNRYLKHRRNKDKGQSVARVERATGSASIAVVGWVLGLGFRV